MAAQLEDLLRQCAANGCTHLTVYPVHSEDNKTVYWHARATPSTQHRYVHEINLDIVAAITKVLTTMPAAKRRAPSKKGMLDLSHPGVEPPIDMDESAERINRLATPEPEVTATVTAPAAPAIDSPVDLDGAFGDINEWLPKT